jgi:hypothetical protein
MWLRLKVWLTGGKAVWLKDYDGEITKSVAYIDPWGELYAFRYGDRRCMFNADGTVSGVSYVTKWKYVD